MGEMTDRAKGLANEAAGNIKQAAGKATDNASLHAKGVAQERKGEAQQAAGKVKGALGDDI
ncbi:CsbD family protein [Novosphingobium sp. KCTC 2891]|uniref:CsbD family protein n=1 Tax=Novosphingobium sp. KCTC 2891 TaxID=2989730 RepID=UPI002221CF3A|nr:CsbD family protein [Novosphingobium sp. KCTC 2891]MCW1382851.1 CsbD family protein [Novosphingobium sp. KCTC 2891]